MVYGLCTLLPFTVSKARKARRRHVNGEHGAGGGGGGGWLRCYAYYQGLLRASRGSAVL